MPNSWLNPSKILFPAKAVVLTGALLALSLAASRGAHAAPVQAQAQAEPTSHPSLLDDPAFEIFLTKTAKPKAQAAEAAAQPVDSVDKDELADNDADDDSSDEALDPAHAQRVSHAHELLGRYYDRSVVRMGEKLQDVDRFVRDSVRKALPASYRRKHAAKLAQTILDESRKYGFDPIFLMAVIRNESAFQPKVRGTSGEIGLMQLMPATGRELARRAKIKWHGKKTLESPEENVRIGAYYISVLREKLDSHGRLYLSAYNMGLKHLRRARARSIWPKDYVQRVMHCYISYYKEIRQVVLSASHKSTAHAGVRTASVTQPASDADSDPSIESLTSRVSHLFEEHSATGKRHTGQHAAVSSAQQKRLAADESTLDKPTT
jgi:soluble lytic murein transglycosylase